MTDTAFPTPLLDAALQQAITHHQAGQPQEAEHLYRAILQIRPSHPDANHNLGVLLGQTEGYATGLPYLKAALEGNPSQGQYWLSYAQALLVFGQHEEAKMVIETAMQCGLDTPTVQSLRNRIDAALQKTDGRERRTEKPSSVSCLPQAERNQLVVLFRAERHAALENQARLLLERYPNSGFVWKALGIALQKQARDALFAFQKAAEFLPEDAESAQQFEPYPARPRTAR